jgi:hypothetical protein
MAKKKGGKKKAAKKKGGKKKAAKRKKKAVGDIFN